MPPSPTAMFFLLQCCEAKRDAIGVLLTVHSAKTFQTFASRREEGEEVTVPLVACTLNKKYTRQVNHGHSPISERNATVARSVPNLRLMTVRESFGWNSILISALINFFDNTLGFTTDEASFCSWGMGFVSRYHFAEYITQSKHTFSSLPFLGRSTDSLL